MLTINLIREKRDFVIERLKVKNFEAETLINNILELDLRRRETQTKTDFLQSEMNKISKEIGYLIKEGKQSEADASKSKTSTLKEEIKILSEKLIAIDGELRNEIIKLPNLPHESVARGFGADNNVKVSEC